MLSRPPEPLAIKTQTQEHINQTNGKLDALLFWFGNKLPSYLWKEGGWSQPLKASGYTWQSFLRVLALHKKELIQWIQGTISWTQLLTKIESTLKDPTFQSLMTR